MARIREIKKRIGAVKNIQRITKTMQMIATAKFTASHQRAEATKPYTQTIRRLVGEVASAAGEVEHPLIDGPPAPLRRELLLYISSDRGLCGAYNGNVFRAALAHYRALEADGVAMDLEVSGKKAISFFKFHGMDPSEQYIIGDKPAYEDIERIAKTYIAKFTEGEYDAIRVAYMRFESASRQVPEVLQLLPIQPDSGDDTDETPAKTTASGAIANYEFSPSSTEMLADLLPLSVKAQLFQCINDAIVSEQMMRMVAMKAATENAKDLGKLLTRQFNRARQGMITTELSEIVSGTAALE